MGNRTAKVSGGATTSYSYNLNNNELTSNGGTYTYDNNGNLVQKSSMLGETYDYAYDFENRLTKATYTFMASESARFEYDGVGQRTRKVGLTDTTRYTWDGLYPVVEWNNQGKLKQTFVYANGLLLGVVDSTVTTQNRYYVLHDGLGSSICLTDSAANIKRSLIYSDFGQSLVDTTASSVPSLNRLYAGYSWDATPANFYWMLGRQSYDPTIGRFGQEDLWLGDEYLPVFPNPYSYALNNPIVYVDPTGLEAQMCVRPLTSPYVGWLSVHCYLITSSGSWGFDSEGVGPEKYTAGVRGQKPKCKKLKCKCSEEHMDKDIQNSITSKEWGPGKWNAFSYNCCDWVNSILMKNKCGSIRSYFPNYEWETIPYQLRNVK